MSIPAPVLKALWQKKEISHRYQHFRKRKLHVKTFKCLKSALTSFIMGTFQLNNESSPKFLLTYAFHVMNGLIIFFLSM